MAANRDNYDLTRYNIKYKIKFAKIVKLDLEYFM